LLDQRTADRRHETIDRAAHVQQTPKQPLRKFLEAWNLLPRRFQNLPFLSKLTSVERMGWRDPAACGSYCSISVPQMGDKKLPTSPPCIINFKTTPEEVLGGLEPSFKKVPKSPLSFPN